MTGGIASSSADWRRIDLLSSPAGGCSPNGRFCTLWIGASWLFCGFLDASGVDLLAAFYTYALTVDAVSKNPAQYVGRPSVGQDHTTTAALTRREAMRLLDAAVADFARSHTLVDLRLSTGVRISEALTTTQAGLFRDRLVIRRKGGKKAGVALPEHTATALHGLVGIMGTDVVPGGEADRLIFTTRTGAPWARTNAHTTLTRLARKAGITKPMSSHVLRHTHATLALELGVPLHHLQDSLGHADPRTTRRYDLSRRRLTNSSARTVGGLFD